MKLSIKKIDNEKYEKIITDENNNQLLFESNFYVYMDHETFDKEKSLDKIKQLEDTNSRRGN